MRYLEQLKREGSTALWHNYLLGHAFDLSGNGNHGTLSSGGWFDQNGFNNKYLGAGAIVVPHSASLAINTFTVVIVVNTKRISQFLTSNLPTMASKDGNGGAICWNLRLNDSSPGTVVSLDGTTAGGWVSPSKHTGTVCWGCSIKSNDLNIPLYRDGVLADAAMSAAANINITGATLYIGNYTLDNRGFGRNISHFLIFNKILTATEHARVYGELTQKKSGVLP